MNLIKIGHNVKLLCHLGIFRWAISCPFLFILILLKQFLLNKNNDLSEVQTWIILVEGEHTDH